MSQAIARHLTSAISLVAIAGNLLVWVLLLIPISLLGALPVRRVGAAVDEMIERIYRAAVRVDSFWLKRVLGLDIVVHGAPPDDRKGRLIVLSNHRTWFDVLVLQDTIVASGPIARFLIKRELIFVPIVGWICMALRFPRLRRSGDADSRSQDLSAVTRFAVDHGEGPCAVVVFAEGTRFSDAKRRNAGAPFRHLLAPRAGGFGVLLGEMRDSVVLDATLIYPRASRSFWRCLDGTLDRVEVWLEYHDPANISDVNDWLLERWQHKDARIDQALGKYGEVNQ